MVVCSGEAIHTGSVSAYLSGRHGWLPVEPGPADGDQGAGTCDASLTLLSQAHWLTHYL